MCSLCYFTHHPQTTHAAIREHIQADMSDRAQGFYLFGERMFGVHFQLLGWQQFTPEQALGFDLAVRTAFDERGLNRARIRVVALEVQGDRKSVV